jgi:large subunit ribosomal protein L10
MAITKQQKKDLIQGYITDLDRATNTVIVQQNSISVPTATKVRKQVTLQDGKFSVVRKRLFLRAMKEAGLEEIGLDQLDGSILAVHAHSDEFGPLKAVNKFLKEFAKENKGAQFTFLGGWFEKKWQGPEYVNELANVPTKEELLAKLCYLFKYPLQSFACALNEVAKKDSSVVATE